MAKQTKQIEKPKRKYTRKMQTPKQIEAKQAERVTVPTEIVVASPISSPLARLMEAPVIRQAEIESGYERLAARMEENLVGVLESHIRFLARANEAPQRAAETAARSQA